MNEVSVNTYVAKGFLAAEAMKTLRTNLVFSGVGIRAIGLTSYSVSEGKSTVSFQLAASFAQADNRVLLLDADLRKSVMWSRLNPEDRIKGLSHYLSGMASLDDVICGTDIPGLSVVFSGVHVPNAAELLGSAVFRELILILKQRFDYVIVNTPPLGQVIDCAVIAPELDGVVLVIDTTKNSRRLERRLKNQLEKSRGKLLGVVLNRVDFKDKLTYYGKAYDRKYSCDEWLLPDRKKVRR